MQRFLKTTSVLTSLNKPSRCILLLLLLLFRHPKMIMDCEGVNSNAQMFGLNCSERFGARVVSSENKSKLEINLI